MTALDIEGRMNLVGFTMDLSLLPAHRRQLVINCVFSTCDISTFPFLKSAISFKELHISKTSNFYLQSSGRATDASGQLKLREKSDLKDNT